MVDLPDGRGIVFADGGGSAGGSGGNYGTDVSTTAVALVSMSPAASAATCTSRSTGSTSVQPDPPQQSTTIGTGSSTNTIVMANDDQESMLTAAAIAAAAEESMSSSSSSAQQQQGQRRGRSNTFDILDRLVSSSIGPSPATAPSRSQQMLNGGGDDAVLMNAAIAATMGLGGTKKENINIGDRDDDCLLASSETVSQDGSQTQSLSQGTHSQEDALFYRSDDDDLLDDADHDEVLNVAEVPLLSLDEAMAAIVVGKEDHVQEQCDALSGANGSESSRRGKARRFASGVCGKSTAFRQSGGG